MVIQHGENKRAAVGGTVLCLAETRVVLKGDEVRLQHAARARSPASHEHARRRIAGHGEKRDASLAGGNFHIGPDGLSASDDDGARAILNGEQLRARSVADEDHEMPFLGGVFFEASGKCFALHRGDDEKELLLFVAEIPADELGAEGARDIGERCGDDARCGGFIARGEKMMRDFECVQQTEAAIVIIHHGQAAQSPTFDELNGVVDGGVGVDADDIRLHHIVDARGEVVDEHGRLRGEFTKDEINARVRLAAAGGDDIFPARQPFEFRVAECCADGIHVGILVADDDSLHAAQKSDAPRAGKDGKCDVRVSALRRHAEHDVEARCEFARLRAFERGEIHCDCVAQLLIAHAAPDAVLFIAGMAFDVALRRQQIFPLRLHLVVNVRRPSRIRHRLDRAEKILARAASEKTPEALEIPFALFRIARARMQVGPAVVALPDFHERIAHRVALRIENAPAHVSNLADGGSDRVIDDDEIVIRIERQMVRVKRPLRLRRRSDELFGKSPRRRKKREAHSSTGEKATAVERGEVLHGDLKLRAGGKVVEKRTGGAKSGAQGAANAHCISSVFLVSRNRRHPACRERDK